MISAEEAYTTQQTAYQPHLLLNQTDFISVIIRSSFLRMNRGLDVMNYCLVCSHHDGDKYWL